MQIAKLVPAIAVAGLMATSAFAAEGYRAEARLAAPAAAPVTASVGEVAWTCQGDACVGEASHRTLDNPVRECRKVAAQLGALSAYSTHGLKLDAGDLKACNIAAKTNGGATASK